MLNDFIPLFISVLTILVALGLSVIGEALTPSSYFSTVDQGRLQAVFEAAQPFGDIPNAHYSIMGLNLLGATIPKSQVSYSVCSVRLLQDKPPKMVFIDPNLDQNNILFGT